MKEALAYTSAVMDKIGFPILLALIPVLFLLETKFQLRKRVQGRWKRILINISTGLPSFVLLRALFIPAMVWLSTENEHWQIGLNYLLPLPGWVKFVIGFLLLDYFIYLWHRLTHIIPFLWRFHLVHHTDLDLDISTAIRFHFGELVLSIIFRGMSVVIIGASPLLVLVYEICFEVANNFHHSNWNLPPFVEKKINYLFVTPRMHGIHHSVLVKERNSNWGTIFSFWDRLHRTFSGRNNNGIVIGEAVYQDKKKLTVVMLLLLPFKGENGFNRESEK
jgi:sterol desaturase/sphingolipid hydroxylase (fatty acid hydroxylase superfamily)